MRDLKRAGILLLLACLLLGGCSRTTEAYQEVLASGSEPAEPKDPYWEKDTVEKPSMETAETPWLGGPGKEPGHEEGFSLKGDILNVGQGSAAVFESNGEFVVVDAGSSEGYEQNLIAYLERVKPASIKYLVLTHWDVDHIAAAIGVLKNFEVETVLGAGYTLEETFRTYTSLVNYITGSGVPFAVPAPGDVYKFGDCEIVMNGPVKQYEEENSNSLSMVITDGISSLYIGGDTTSESERDIIASGADLDVDVYVCNHHGSSSSSCQEFITALSPEYTIISCDGESGYGHPTGKVLGRIRDAGSVLYRTDTQGDIVFLFDGNGITFELSPTGNWEPGVYKEN